MLVSLVKVPLVFERNTVQKEQSLQKQGEKCRARLFSGRKEDVCHAACLPAYLSAILPSESAIIHPTDRSTQKIKGALIKQIRPS